METSDGVHLTPPPLHTSLLTPESDGVAIRVTLISCFDILSWGLLKKHNCPVSSLYHPFTMSPPVAPPQH